MGCDLHLHVEVKIKGKWHHYSQPLVERDYNLFEKMAGVRGDLSEAIAPPRGLPADVTFLTRYDSEEHWGEDGHSHSYLTAEEIKQLGEWHQKRNPRNVSFESDALRTYVFGNSFAGFIDYPEDRLPGLEDVRFVFWFDN